MGRGMKLWTLTLALFMSSSCGPIKRLAGLDDSHHKEIVSHTVQRIISSEDEGLSEELEERFVSLHAYSTLAQKYLLEFDDLIDERPLNELYLTSQYASLMAIKTQTDEIEGELRALVDSFKEKSKVKLFKKKVEEYRSKSKLASMALAGLAGDSMDTDVTKSEVEAELLALAQKKEFMIYEKNIEHLSHMLEMETTSSRTNITGSEFPAKVWALTFNNGPARDATVEITNALMKRDMKGTFFMLTSMARELMKEAQEVKNHGMDVQLNSFTNRELTKVGGLTLEREITTAKEVLEATIKNGVDYIRLPYGAGIEVPTIKKVVSKNNLIHVLWNVDSLDWLAQSPDRIISRTKRLMKKSPRDSGIILFHDGHKRSVEASQGIMEFLNSEARRVCTVSKIVKDMNEGVTEVCSKSSF